MKATMFNSAFASLIYRITVFENFRFLILLHTWNHQPDALVDQEGDGKDLQEGIFVGWLDQVRYER